MYLPGALQIGGRLWAFLAAYTEKDGTILKAYESRQKEQLEFINIAGWVNGMYAGYSLGAAFGGKRAVPGETGSDFPVGGRCAGKHRVGSRILSAYAAMFNKQFEEKGGNPSCSDVNIP